MGYVLIVVSSIIGIILYSVLPRGEIVFLKDFVQKVSFTTETISVVSDLDLTGNLKLSQGNLIDGVDLSEFVIEANNYFDLLEILNVGQVEDAATSGQLITNNDYYQKSEVDNQLQRYLSLTGGTLTGGLVGTTARFVSLTGSLTGNVIGNVAGDVSGNARGLTDSPAITISGLTLPNGASLNYVLTSDANGKATWSNSLTELNSSFLSHSHDTRYYTQTQTTTLLNSYLKLTGGTLTGSLLGTQAMFTTFTGNLVGNVAGDLSGNVSGIHTGNVVGNVSGTAGGLSGNPSIAIGGLTLSTGAGNGYLLTSDASGVSSWQNYSAALLPIGTEGQALYNNAGTWTSYSELYYDDVNGRIGIGITSPNQKLHVIGNVQLNGNVGIGTNPLSILHITSDGNEIEANKSAEIVGEVGNPTLDQENTAEPDFEDMVWEFVIGYSKGQSFTAGITGDLAYIDLESPSPWETTVYIRSGENMSGTILATSGLSESLGLYWYRIYFSPPASVTSGQKYTIDFGDISSGYVTMGNNYAGGRFYDDYWSADVDYAFKTYVLQPPEVIDERYGWYIANDGSDGSDIKYGLYVDTVSGGSTANYGAYFADKVGIGTTSPAYKLDVAGTTQMTGFRLTTSPTAGYVLTSDASGVGTWQVATVSGAITGSGTSGYLSKFSDGSSITNSALFESLGNIGIGTTNPSAKLDVTGGSVLFSGTSGSTPTSGSGTRMMWIPSRYSFRAGTVTGDQWDNSSIGNYTFAAGYNTTASGNYAIALGSHTTANGNSALATGLTTTASGQYATAMGSGSIASGWYSTALGNYTTATAWASTSLGEMTTASGQWSTAMGRGIQASGNYSFAIALSDQSGINVTQANTMSIMGGNVGIGTTSPGTRLAVAGLTGTASYNLVRVDTATGNFYYDSSSIRYKENVQPLNADFLKILDVTPKIFTDKTSGNTEIGFIAEDFVGVGLDDLVIYDQLGQPNGLKYDKVPLYLLGMAKSQQTQLAALQSAIETLQLTDQGMILGMDISVPPSQNLIDRIQQVLEKLGIAIKDGIVSVKDLVAQTINVKTGRLEQIEMIDKATNDIYCTWVENGEWIKVKGTCDSITPTLTPIPTVSISF